MTFHRYLAVDLVTGTIRDELPLEQVTFGETLNRAHPFAARLPVDAPGATPQAIQASRTVVLVERNGVIVGDGIVWDPKVSRRRDDRTLELSGASLWSYLNRRRIREDRTYTDVDHALIAADLVAWTQGAGSTVYGPTAGDPTGDVRIDVSSVAALGFVRDRLYRGDERKRVGEALEQLADVIGGPDLAIRWRWDSNPDGTDTPMPELRAWARRGVRLADSLELDVNVTGYEYLEAGSQQATHVDAIGQGEGAAMKVAAASDPSLWPSYPRLDGIAAHKDASDLDTLEGHARGTLAARRVPPGIVRVTLDPDKRPRFGSWQTGDEATVRISDGWTQVDEIRRIVGWEMTLTADGAETVDVDLAKLEE